MKNKKLFEKIIGFKDETLEDYLKESGFLVAGRFDNYILYRKHKVEILYDDKRCRIITYQDSR